MYFSRSETVFAVLPAAVVLLAALFLVGACSDDEKTHKEAKPPEQKTEVAEKTTSPTTMLETTGNSRPPEVTLGDGTGGEPEVVIRLEGDPSTTFSGLCSLGDKQNVLSGLVPKRFEFDLKGRRLTCRIEKRDNKKGNLKVVLITGEATRSVRQTNTPGKVIKVSYKG